MNQNLWNTEFDGPMPEGITFAEFRAMCAEKERQHDIEHAHWWLGQLEDMKRNHPKLAHDIDDQIAYTASRMQELSR